MSHFYGSLRSHAGSVFEVLDHDDVLGRIKQKRDEERQKLQLPGDDHELDDSPAFLVEENELEPDPELDYSQEVNLKRDLAFGGDHHDEEGFSDFEGDKFELNGLNSFSTKFTRF